MCRLWPPRDPRPTRSPLRNVAAGHIIIACALAVVAGLLAAPARAAERPTVMGRNAGVSAGHPLTTAAAFEILARGGNAFDAGVAALLVGGVVEQDFYSLGGEALVLVYPRSAGKVVAVVGQGWAPEGATIDWYTARGKTLDGDGLDPAVVPGALHAALTVLDQWGTMSFEAGGGAGDRIRRAGLSAAAAHGGGDRAEREIHRAVAGQPALLAQARRLHVQARRDHQVPDAGAHADPHGRGRARPQERGPQRRHRGGARPLLQGRHRGRDGRLPQAARRAVRARRFRRVLRPHRRAEHDDLSRLRGLQASVRQPGAGAARGAQHPGELRPQGDEAQQPRLSSHRGRGAEARLCGSRHLLRRSRLRAHARRGTAVEGLRQGARETDRSEQRVARLRRRQPAAVRSTGQGHGTTGSPTSPMPASPRDRCPIRSRSPAPARTPPTSPSSTATATSSTRRRAAAGSAAPSSSATPASA